MFCYICNNYDGQGQVLGLNPCKENNKSIFQDSEGDKLSGRRHMTAWVRVRGAPGFWKMTLFDEEKRRKTFLKSIFNRSSYRFMNRLLENSTLLFILMAALILTCWFWLISLPVRGGLYYIDIGERWLSLLLCFTFYSFNFHTVSLPQLHLQAWSRIITAASVLRVQLSLHVPHRW